jgi:di/tricarboxylate transporter
MLAAAATASVLKNTTTTAMFLPVVLGLAMKAKVPPSKLLMPLAFGAILGGSCTLIGTSTNLAVSGTITRLGQAPYTMFELAPVGILMLAAGMLYMLTLGRHLLPSRGFGESITEQYKMREYISELIVLPDSRLVGQTLGEANLNEQLDLNVIGIVRSDGEKVSAPASSERIRRRDSLIVEGVLGDILRVKEEAGLEIKPDFSLSDTQLASGNVELFEALVQRNSRLNGQTLKSIGFRERYNLTVLAINRHGRTFVSKLSSVELQFGDVLLIQGRRSGIDLLAENNEVLILEGDPGLCFVSFPVADEGDFRLRNTACDRGAGGSVPSARDENGAVPRALLADQFSASRFDRVHDELRCGDGEDRSR